MQIRGPAWIGHLLLPKRESIPWGRAVRIGIAVVTPVTVGMIAGVVVPTVLCSLGAMVTSLADKGGPYRGRLARLSIVIACGACGFLLGGSVHGNAVLTVVVVMAAGLVSSLMSRISAVMSTAALQFILFTVVSSGISFGPLPIWVPPLLYATGAAWTTALSIATGIGRFSAPDRALVADVYRQLASLLEASRVEPADAAERVRRTDDARQAITTAMNAAYDAVLTTREQSGGRDGRFGRLTALLNGATPIVEATLTLIRDGRRVPAGIPAAVESIADSIAHPVAVAPSEKITKSDDRPDTIELPRIDAGSPAVSMLESGIRSVESILKGRTPATEEIQLYRSGPGSRFSGFLSSLESGSATWLPTLRLVLCLGVAEAVGQMLGLERSFWVVLSVAVVLKPDFGSVFARAIQRALGTVVGVGLGGLVVTLVPFGPWLLVAVALFAFMLPISIRRNYGMLATFITPLVVLLLDLIHHNGEALVFYRLIDTLVGCSIVLLVGYLPWPGTWRSRTRIGERFANTADDVLQYMAVALTDQEGERTSLRRKTYRSLSDLRTVFQQAMAEPPPVSTRAAAWWPAIVALERLTDASTAVAIRTEHGDTDVPRAGVRQAIRAMRELVAATRLQRPPDDMQLPDDPALAGVRAELQAVYGIVSRHSTAG